MTSKLEWKMRLKLADGGVLVGGYLGWNRGELYLADELSGEVRTIQQTDIQDFDVRKY